MNDFENDFLEFKPLGPNDLIPPRYDFVFKELMLNEKVRTGFLSAVLGIEPNHIISTVIKNTNLQKEYPDIKQGILDVRISAKIVNVNSEDVTDNEVDMEIQLAKMNTWADRSVFYVSKMLIEQTNVDAEYSNFKKCIGINILDFKYLKNEDSFHNVFHIANDKSHNIYTDILEWHIIELPKLPIVDDNTVLYNWAKFFKSEKRVDFMNLAKKDACIKEAYSTLEKISSDEVMRMAYTSYQKKVMDEKTRLAEAKDEGIQKGKSEIAKDLVDMVLSGASLDDLLKFGNSLIAREEPTNEFDSISSSD